jgi:hypothetical protein
LDRRQIARGKKAAVPVVSRIAEVADLARADFSHRPKGVVRTRAALEHTDHVAMAGIEDLEWIGLENAARTTALPVLDWRCSWSVMACANVLFNVSRLFVSLVGFFGFFSNVGEQPRIVDR